MYEDKEEGICRRRYAGGGGYAGGVDIEEEGISRGRYV
jgi:hypothetical protein